MIASPEIPVNGLHRQIFRALRHRNFRLYWSSLAVSLIGTWMQNVAQSWLIYRITDSPFMLGLINVISLVPVLPVSLLAGVISDKFPRRKLIILTESVLVLQAFTLAILTWLNIIQVWHIILLTFIAGTALAMEQPARLAFVRDTVGREDLSNAVALSSSVSNAGRIIGPAIAGILVTLAGEALCFFLNGLSFLVVIISLSAIQLQVEDDQTKEFPSIVGNLLEGFHYILHNRTIFSLMLMVATSSFFILPFLVLMPVIAKDILKAGPQGLGFLVTSVGVGAIIGALVVATLQKGNRGKWLAWGNILGPFFLIIFYLSPSLLVSVLFVLMAGISNAVRQTLANSLIQLEASEDYHGRVMSIFYLLFAGMSQVGAFVFGAAAEKIGVPLALSIGAILNIFVGIAIVIGIPDVYRLR